MPLIDSPRLKPGDRDAWDRASAGDLAWAATMGFGAKVETAEHRISTWTRGKRGYASVSWGKDSVVIADMVVALTDWPLASHRYEPGVNPDVDRVRDAFFVERSFGRSRYREFSIDLGWGNDADADPEAWRIVRESEAAFGPCVIMGLRGDESRQRRRMSRFGGWRTDRHLSPIHDWSARDVFAYLATHDLPIHPAYAMSFGGAIDRERLRVATIGGAKGRGFGRLDWERAYYPEFFGALDGDDAMTHFSPTSVDGRRARNHRLSDDESAHSTVLATDAD